MKNALRTARTRVRAIEAAITVLMRDGPSRLTIDAVALESGISKGGVLHHFPSKRDILKALVERQMEISAKFHHDYQPPPDTPHPGLQTSIALCRKAVDEPDAVFLALLAGLSDDRTLLEAFALGTRASVDRLHGESEDQDLVVLRWLAAIGINHLALLGISPFDGEERKRLFDRLADDRAWPSASDQHHISRRKA